MSAKLTFDVSTRYLNCPLEFFCKLMAWKVEFVHLNRETGWKKHNGGGIGRPILYYGVLCEVPQKLGGVVEVRVQNGIDANMIPLPSIAKHVFMDRRDIFLVLRVTLDLLLKNFQQVLRAEDLIANRTEMPYFILSDANENDPILPQKFPEQH